MRVSVIPLIAAFALVSTFGSGASAQTIEGCSSQCYQTYSVRAEYCYARYGGYNYDAELCIMNEYEAYIDCIRNCESTYGPQASLDPRRPSIINQADAAAVG